MSINPTNTLPSSVKPKEQPASTLDQKPSSEKNGLTKKIAKLFKKTKQVSASNKSVECDPPKFETQSPLSVRPKTKRSMQRKNSYDFPKFAETLDIQAPTLLETDTIFHQVNPIQKILNQWLKTSSMKIREGYINQSSKIREGCTNQPSDQKEPNCIKALERILTFFRNTDEKTLDLSHLNLTSLPDVFYFPSFRDRLSEINLDQNKLTSLPQSFGKLQALTKLYLTNNHLAEFPEILIELPNLKELGLSENQLTQLPESLTELRALQKLLVRENQLTALPINLGQLHKLEELELGVNQLENLPESCVNLTNLKDLSISHNKFVELPEYIGSLSRLEVLRIRRNQIEDLPESFIQLKTLKKIYLAYNSLSKRSLEILCQLPDCKINGIERCKINGMEYADFYQKEFGSYPEDLDSNQEDLCTSEGILNQWKKRNAGGARVEALLNIQNFCKDTNTNKLNLHGLDLVDLPDIFHFEPFVSRLEQLDVSGNKLQELPPSIHSLKVLKTLNLSSNQFNTNLPDIFHFEPFVSRLEQLDVSGNKLQELPPSIHSLKVLKTLNLSSNQFHNESFSDLPETLTCLNFNGNRLSICPRFLCGLLNLEVLNLSNNDLVFDLGVVLSNLQNLKDLDLSYNPNLFLFDDQIPHLLAIDKINLTGCNNFVSLNNHADRRISHILPLSVETEKTIKQSLKQLCQIAKREPIDLCDLLKVREVRSWLNRLFSIADFQKGGDIRKILAINVLDCLNEANDSSNFRQVFTTIIRGATESCEDRVALSFIDVSLAYQLATIDIHNMRELADFLIKGPCSITVLRRFAQQLILKSPSVDQIEVHLGLLVKLKERLNLPIDIEEISYFNLSGLTSENLDDAAQHVLDMREDSRYKLLIDQDKWKEALKKNYPIEFEDIEKERDVAMQKGENGKTIMKKFYKELIELTRKALQENHSDDCSP